MEIINILLYFYVLICMIIQQSIFVFILKVSTSIVLSRVRTYIGMFRRPTKRFLCFLFFWLILIDDSYFSLFMKLFFSAQECAHRMGKMLLDVGSSEIGMSANIVPVTIFFTIENSFIFKDVG